MLPAVGPAVQVPPPAPTQVHVQVRLAGKVSWTEAPVADAGPAFAATIVQVTPMPGTAVVVRGEVTPAGAIGDVFVDVPSGFPSIDNAAVRAFQAMHCQPRTALQASQWLQRTFLFEPRSTALVDVR